MASDWGLLLVRVIVGFLVFGHGAMKLFGWFGGSGLRGSSDMMGTYMRLRPAMVWTLLAGLTEAGGGLLFGLGLLHPLGSLGIVASMLVAVVLAHWGKLWATNGGMELPLTYLTVGLAVGLAGQGTYSLDAVLGITLPEPVTFEGGLILVILGLIVVFATRAPKTIQVPTHQ